MRTGVVAAYGRQVLVTLVLVLVLAMTFTQRTDAAQFTNRQLFINPSTPGAVAEYVFAFDFISTTDVGSLKFEFCSNDPFVGKPCTPPLGFNATSAVLVQQSGETGFSVSSLTTPHELIITRGAQAVSPQTAEYNFSDINNPSGAAETFYVRVMSYESTDATGNYIDYGGIAVTTTDTIDIRTYVPPYLEFCVGIEIIGSDCANTTGNSASFGQLSSSETRSAQSQMQVATNGDFGYTIMLTGTTMTAGNRIITGMSSPDTSRSGQSQFGTNLRANTSPVIGQEPTGPGSAIVAPDYAQVNRYTFRNGAVLVTNPNPTERIKFTNSYIVNIPESQPKGNYATTLTYIATASF